jgi:hypothetical protein
MNETDSMQLYLNSKYADEIFDTQGQNSNVLFTFDYISCPSNYYINISVVNCTIPFSFYQVNQYNQTIAVQYTGFDPVFYNLPFGNYNANQLATWITLNIPNFVCTYNSITNKFKFVSTGGQFTILTTQTTARELLGLSPSDVQNISFSGILNSYYGINLASVRTIQVRSNYNTGNITTFERNSMNDLASIPVITLPNSLITYTNPNNFRTNLYINEINNIQIQLLTQDGVPLNLNGQYFNITLQIDIIQFV